MTAPMSVFAIFALLVAFRVVGALLRPRGLKPLPQIVPYFDEAGCPIYADGSAWTRPILQGYSR